MAGGSSWESILKWSLSQSDGTGPARQISDEERQWFQEAVGATQVDVVHRMKEIVTVMEVAEEKLLSQGVTLDELQGLLEELQEHVESIDMANDLPAIGGLPPLLKYLQSSHASLRSHAAEVVSTVVQNNPSSQAKVMAAGFGPVLLHNFTSDADVTARTKALGAISSLIRHNKPGLDAFRLGGGLAALKSALLVENARLQRKALYALLYLMQESRADRAGALDLGFGPVLAGLAASSDPDVRQGALQSLLSIALLGSKEAHRLAEGTSAPPSSGTAATGSNLREILSHRMEDLRTLEGQDLEALLEERHLIDQLWEQCFAGGSKAATAGSRSEAELDLAGGADIGPDRREGAGGRDGGTTLAVGVGGTRPGSRPGARGGGQGQVSSSEQSAPVLLLGPPGGTGFRNS